jgi:hypothetical protein
MAINNLIMSAPRDKVPMHWAIKIENARSQY